MPIFTPHPDHDRLVEKWTRCRTVAAGEDAVKAGGTRYLPSPSGEPLLSQEAFTVYAGYVQRANFYNATRRTIDGLVGAIFQRPPDVTLPPEIEGLAADVTLTNVPLDRLALQALREVLTVGRAGVLVDMAETVASDNRPFLSLYQAEDIVSWRSARLGGDETLVRVVLREHVEREDPKDPYQIHVVPQYRELFLNADGVYQVRVWSPLAAEELRDAATARWEPAEPVTPIGRGEPFGFIPFTFINAHSITPEVEDPPLLDLVNVNLSHYRSSAELENLLHYVGSPTPWVSGLDAGFPLRIGSNVAWRLSENGRAGMLEMSGAGATAIAAAMEMKLQQMASLGARLLEGPPRSSETATSVAMRHAGEHASLRTIAGVVEAGLTRALQMAASWNRPAAERDPATIPATIQLSKDFFAIRMTPAELQALVLAWQAGGMSWDNLFFNLSRAGFLRPGTTIDTERHLIGADAEVRWQLEQRRQNDAEDE